MASARNLCPIVWALTLAFALVAGACRGPTGPGTPDPATTRVPTCPVAVSPPSGASPTAEVVPTALTRTPPPAASSSWRYEPVYSVAWSPAGDALAIATEPGLQIHQPGLDHPVSTLETRPGASAVAYDPSGRLLAAGTLSNTVYLWDAETEQLVHTLHGPDQARVEYGYAPSGTHLNSLAFSPDGTLLAATVMGYYSGGFGSIWRWRVETEETLPVLGTYGGVVQVAFSPNGASLAAAAHLGSCSRGGGGISVWRSDTKERYLFITDQENDVLSLAFHPRGGLIAGAGGCGSRCMGPGVVHIWDATTGVEQRMLSAGGDTIRVAYSGDGALLACADEDGTIRLWEADSRRLLRTWEGHAGAVIGLTFSPQGQSLASWDRDGLVRVWEGL